MNVASPPPKPLLLFDADCSFCRRWVSRWKSITGDAIDYEPSQSARARYPEIPKTAFDHAVQLIEPTGQVTPAAHGVFRSLAAAGRYRPLLWLYHHLPPFAATSEAAYRLVARNRNTFDRLDLLLIGPCPVMPTYTLTRQVFLRGLAIVYLIAFVSLFVQVDGLYGSQGILPIARYMDAVRAQFGDSQGFWKWPTVFWLGASDASLHAACYAGIACSALLFAGLFPLVQLAVLWFLYLSFVVAGRDFLSFQWDALLLEAGFLAIFFAPPLWPARRPHSVRPPSLILFLLRWLVFRLMFLSAVVKLTSGDETWRSLTALRYHYETQPLPPWTAWYAHHAPTWFQTTSCAVMFGAEGLVPLLFFLPRRPRILAAILTVLLQLLIIATGNFGFFNVLTIVLCVPLLDDVFLGWLLRRKPPAADTTAIDLPRAPAILRRLSVVVAAVPVLLVSVMQFAGTLGLDLPWPGLFLRTYTLVEPFRSVNTYGLFAVMTTRRPEILVEGSDDGVTWKAYEFRYKPGDVTRRPKFCAPHMPRLDWQMWFAALGPAGQSPWFYAFLERLAENSPPVVSLLAHNPFPDHPPRYLRATLYDYRFTTPAERTATGAWWHREVLGEYVPPVALRRSESGSTSGGAGVLTAPSKVPQ